MDIDAFEQLGNILFYFILSLITLSMLGVDPTQMFLSLTGLFLPLSFLFSSSASKYFEVRKNSPVELLVLALFLAINAHSLLTSNS